MWSCSCLLWPHSTAVTTPPTHPKQPGKLHSDHKTHTRLPPKYGGKGASHSPKNMALVCTRNCDFRSTCPVPQISGFVARSVSHAALDQRHHMHSTVLTTCVIEVCAVNLGISEGFASLFGGLFCFLGEAMKGLLVCITIKIPSLLARQYRCWIGEKVLLN